MLNIEIRSPARYRGIMGFASPSYLILLPLVPLLIWWWNRRRRPAIRYSHLQVMDGLPGGRARVLPVASVALRVATLGFLVLALARPQVPDGSTRLPTEGIAIAFACDVSGSMAEVDFPWTAGEEPVTRLDAARRSFGLFVAGGVGPDEMRFEGRPADQIGLVTFAAWPQTLCPLTLNHSVLLAVLNREKPKGAGLDSGTNVGDAIAECLIRLKSAADRRRVLILLSDGEHNVASDGPDSPLTPRQAAQLAANLGIPIYTIDCGGDPQPESGPDVIRQRESGRAILKSVSDMTGGTSFTANNGHELREVYRTIDRMERKPILSFQYRRYWQFGPTCAMLAFVGLTSLILLERFAWRVFP